MASILFFILPETGHLNATLKLARGLQRRGHHVWYAQIADREEHIRAQGINFVPILEQLFPKGFMSRHSGLNIEFLFDIAGGANLDIGSLRGEVGSVIRRVSPDLIVLDCLFPHVELMTSYFGSIGFPHILLSTTLLGSTHLVLQKTEDVVVIPCPREFDFPHGTVSARHHYVEPSIDLGRHEPALPAHLLLPDKLLLYCSLGSQSHAFDAAEDFLRRALNAAALLPDWQLLLATGAHLDPARFGSVPDNALLVRTAPQLEVLKRARLMITHGGFNTVKECIFFGVPMVAFPLGRDQHLNAARVEYHGLGVTGKLGEASAKRIAEMVREVSEDDGYRRRVQEMGRVFRRYEEAEVGLSVIEAELARASSVRMR